MSDCWVSAEQRKLQVLKAETLVIQNPDKDKGSKNSDIRDQDQSKRTDENSQQRISILF